MSPSTVSRSLSSPGRLSKATEDRIRTVADSLGYRPNRAAQGLSTGRTRCLGLVAPNVSNPFFAEFLRAFQQAADIHGYVVMFVDVNEDANNEAEAHQASPHADGRDCTMRAEGIRTSWSNLSMCRPPSFSTAKSATQVASSSIRAQRYGTQSVSSTHQSFVYVPEAPHAVGDRTRRQACRKYAAEFGMTMIIDEPRIEDRDKAAHAIQVARASKAKAIVAHTDMVAMWILHECHIQGIDVHASMSIVGHDNIEYVAGRLRR